MAQPYYQDGWVALYHGDCLEITDWLEADVLVTDPPYGIAWEAGQLDSARSIRKSATQSIRGDESTAARDGMLQIWGAKPAVVFGSWRQPRPDCVSHRLIWHKQGRHPGVSPAPFFPNDEEIYLLRGGWVGAPSPTVITTTEQRSMEPTRVGHPTPKPLALMEALISKCPPGVVADPFVGAGATLVAAKAQGRRAIGIEIEERYCEIAARRLAQDALDFAGAY